MAHLTSWKEGDCNITRTIRNSQTPGGNLLYANNLPLLTNQVNDSDTVIFQVNTIIFDERLKDTPHRIFTAEFDLGPCFVWSGDPSDVYWTDGVNTKTAYQAFYSDSSENQITAKFDDHSPQIRGGNEQYY